MAIVRLLSNNLASIAPLESQCDFIQKKLENEILLALPARGAREMSIHDLIRQAIIKKAIVRAAYKGHLRLLCPHVLGVKGNRTQCLFYQFEESSEKGLAPDGSSHNWRCIPLDELTDVTVQEGDGHSSADYSLDRQTCVDRADLAISH